MEIVVDEEPRFVTVCLCLHFAALLRRSEIETAAHRDRMNARGVGSDRASKLWQWHRTVSSMHSVCLHPQTDRRSVGGDNG